MVSKLRDRRTSKEIRPYGVPAGTFDLLIHLRMLGWIWQEHIDLLQEGGYLPQNTPLRKYGPVLPVQKWSNKGLTVGALPVLPRYLPILHRQTIAIIR